jgi:putative ABC transport system substrate-binding protein
VQGRNFVLLPQWGDGNVARLPELAVALMNTNVDIIVVDGVVTARAARAVTATIPIVMTASADPFVGGFVQSLARPGGTVTGLSTLAAEIAGKVLEIFKDLIPGLARVAIVIPREVRTMFASAEDQAAKALGIDLVSGGRCDASSTLGRSPGCCAAQWPLLFVDPAADDD